MDGAVGRVEVGHSVHWQWLWRWEWSTSLFELPPELYTMEAEKQSSGARLDAQRRNASQETTARLTARRLI